MSEIYRLGGITEFQIRSDSPLHVCGTLLSNTSIIHSTWQTWHIFNKLSQSKNSRALEKISCGSGHGDECCPFDSPLSSHSRLELLKFKLPRSLQDEFTALDPPFLLQARSWLPALRIADSIHVSASEASLPEHLPCKNHYENPYAIIYWPMRSFSRQA